MGTISSLELPTFSKVGWGRGKNGAEGSAGPLTAEKFSRFFNKGGESGVGNNLYLEESTFFLSFTEVLDGEVRAVDVKVLYLSNGKYTKLSQLHKLSSLPPEDELFRSNVLVLQIVKVFIQNQIMNYTSLFYHPVLVILTIFN